jgi:hypothetical protein
MRQPLLRKAVHRRVIWLFLLVAASTSTFFLALPQDYVGSGAVFASASPDIPAPLQAPNTESAGKRYPAELPKDAELVEHFNKHRKDFEELVRLYQTGERWIWKDLNGSLSPFAIPAYESLLQRLDLTGLSGDGAIWLPDPYSLESGIKARQLNAFHAFQHHGITFNLAKSKYRAYSSRLRRGVWKDYFHIPVVPQVKDGELWWPVWHDGKVFRKARVFDSLDVYPIEWLREPPNHKRGECVFRQVEPRWFLRMCNS